MKKLIIILVTLTLQACSGGRLAEPGDLIEAEWDRLAEIIAEEQGKEILQPEGSIPEKTEDSPEVFDRIEEGIIIEDKEEKPATGNITPLPAIVVTSRKIAAEPINQARKHVVYWGSIPVGELIAGIETGEDKHIFKVAIRSRNLAKVVSKFRSNSKSEIRYNGRGKYTPILWDTNFSLRNKKRTIKLEYSDSGEVTGDYNQPPEKRWKRKAVEQKLKDGAYDPLTMVMVARQKVRDSFRGGKREFSLPLYDGRRRSKFNFRVRGITTNKFIHVSVTETAVAGYTDNELRRMKERGAEIHLYLSIKDFWPVQATGKSLLGTVKGVIEKTCDSFNECLE